MNKVIKFGIGSVQCFVPVVLNFGLLIMSRMGWEWATFVHIANRSHSVTAFPPQNSAMQTPLNQAVGSDTCASERSITVKVNYFMKKKNRYKEKD